MVNSAILVFGAGALNVDYIFSVEELVIDSESFIKEFHKLPGGSALNTISILNQLGISCSFFGVTGSDEDGSFIENSIRKRGVQLNLKRIEGETGKAFIFVDKLGRRSIYVMPGVNKYLAEIDYPAKIDSKWVHISSLVEEEAFQKQSSWILQLPEKIKISFSPGALYVKYGLKRLEPILEKTEIVFLNKKELSFLIPDTSDLKISVKKLHTKGPKFIAVTLGKNGAVISDGKAFEYQPSLSVKVIDTTGAGDAFSAGVLYGVINSLNLKASLKIGIFLASKAVTQWGAQLEITPEEIKKLI